MSSVTFYSDDPKFYGKVNINGQDIKVKESRESDEFLHAVSKIESGDELRKVGMWTLCLAAWCVSSGLVTRQLFDLALERSPYEHCEIKQGTMLVAALETVDSSDHIRAIGQFLKLIGFRLLELSAERMSK